MADIYGNGKLLGRRHRTAAEKFVRQSIYRCLRAHGYTVAQAHRVKDWSNNKIEMILTGKANPVL